VDEVMTEGKIPFSFPVDVTHVPAAGREYRLTADATQRAAVAAELGIEAVGRLTATVVVSPQPGGGVSAQGRFDADVTQACVVSLAPVPATLGVGFTRHFVPGPVAAPHGKAADGDGDEEEGGWVDPNDEVPDPIVGGLIDLGEVVTEELALALDPYPRAPGASFVNPAKDEEQEANGPFAALAKLKPATPRRTPGEAQAKRDKR
jgi:uncharacterized metal-binding protein YceD (DUF177 family)